MNKIEILAPAGGKEQLVAAVRSGADAVYFGASSFNARRNAENFTDDDFISSVRYCRERGVKAYITLNTIFKDSEKKEFVKTLGLIAKSGADAVIVQDMGAVALIKECCPSLPLHASTQMAVHNKAGALYLQSIGFSRIVLARELSVNEIKEIAASVDAEIEVFVHGAHCMSASGMCYMSSILGARSGNRGLCAQPCRLNFRNGKREYALSLKDMCLASLTDELIAAGVTSFKIEGRMKRPEYVSAAVSAYKNAVSGKKPDIALLQSVFSRSGFTDGYAQGKRDISMFGYRTKEDVLSASDVLSPIANTYRNENPLVGITMDFTVRADEKCVLSVSDGKNTVTAYGEIPEKAIKASLNSESAVKSLSKLGSTFYYAEKISCDIEDGLMLRASDINAVRRNACDELTAVRGSCSGAPFTEPAPVIVSRSVCNESELRLMFRRASQIPATAECDMIILPVREIINDMTLTEKYKGMLCARLPALIYPGDENRFHEALSKLNAAGVRYAYCDNIGAVRIALDCGMKIVGGALLNVLNSDAVAMYNSLGVTDVTLSSEISFDEMKNITSRGKIGMTAYGFMPLMHFRCCPLQGEKGCGECKGYGVLTDRMDKKFTVICENRRYSVLYNTVPLYVGDRNMPGVSYIILDFTRESADDVRKIIYHFKNKKALPCQKTAGLYERELL